MPWWSNWSKAKRLAHAFGGKWTYNGSGSWNCDDDKRVVVRCCAGVDEFDNEVGPPQYWLYEDDLFPLRVDSILFGVPVRVKEKS